MTKLSVNINKVATLRNARGGNNPDVVKVALDCEAFGAEGITVHPRPDERHIRRSDVYELRPLLTTEFNIEGYPSPEFVDLVLKVKPHQVTLVPDAPDQITSNAGWDTKTNLSFLTELMDTFGQAGIRTSIFVGTDKEMIEYAAKAGADRVELYTEPYATMYPRNPEAAIAPFIEAAKVTRSLGMGLNAGHDLSLVNLKYMHTHIPWLDEVSIGHALISDALYMGLKQTIEEYKKLSSFMMNITLLAAQAALADTLAGGNPVLTPVSEEARMNLWDMAMKGGWIMLVLALLSVVCFYIFFERMAVIRKAGKDDPLFMERIRDYIRTGEIKSAINYCRITNTPSARMIEKGITRMGRPVADVQAAIENSGNIEVAKLENGLPVVATIAGGAPMIGFLGTVTGMVQAFWEMSNAGNNIDITLLSGGIYEAMITTVGGLVVGIAAMFAYNYLVTRVDKVVSQMEARTMDFMDLLNEPVQK